MLSCFLKVLSDADKRKKYDKYGKVDESEQFDFEEFMHGSNF